MNDNVIEYIIKAVDKASGPMGKISKSIGTMIKRATVAVAAIAAVAAGLVAFVAKVSKADDAVKKFADRIGVAVEDLSAYHFAASQSGISTQQFNLAIQRSNRRVAEAAKGVGEATGALKDLRIDASKFINLSLDDQMKTLADRFGEVENQGEKLRLAFKLFDSEGVAMLQMLQNNSAELQRMTDRARELGIVVSAQAAANAEHFTNRLGELGSAIKGVGRGIAGELQPLLSGLFGKATDLIIAARDDIVNFVEASIVNITTFGIVMSRVFSRLKELAGQLFTKVGFESFVANAGKAVQWVIGLFIKAGPIIATAMITSFKILWQAYVEYAKWAFNKMLDLFRKEDKAGSLADLLFEKIPEATEESRNQIRSMMEDLGTIVWEKGTEISDGIKSIFNISIESARQQAEAMIESLKEFGEVVEEEQQASFDRSLSYMQELQTMREDYLKQQESETKFLAKYTHDLLVSTTQSIGNAFGAAIVDGENLMVSLENVGKQVLKSIISMLIQVGVQRLVTASISQAAIIQEGASQIGSSLAQVYTNSFASAAAIPYVGWAMAPGVAAANASTAAAGAAANMAIGAGIGASAGLAHDGLTNVPEDGTYILQRGERVLASEQNQDLMDFLGGGAPSGGSLNVENINIYLPNADIRNMSSDELREALIDKLYPAMNRLAREGVFPRTNERGRNR